MYLSLAYYKIECYITIVIPIYNAVDLKVEKLEQSTFTVTKQVQFSIASVCVSICTIKGLYTRAFYIEVGI